MFVVYQADPGGDMTGSGPDLWCGMELGRFDTEDQALDFVDTHWTPQSRRWQLFWRLKHKQ
jgi:hypothetical protein